MAREPTIGQRTDAASWEAFADSPVAALAAFGWGLAEATAFFIVPDVGIGLVGLFGWRRGLRAAGWSLAGALLGGAAMHAAGARLPRERSAHLLDAVPAISPPMIERVEAEMAARGPAAMVLGPLKGTPYKIYARTAGLQGQPLPVVLLWSIPARGGRFLLSALLAALAGRLGQRWLRPRPTRLLTLYVLAWTGFYVAYFRKHGR